MSQPLAPAQRGAAWRVQFLRMVRLTDAETGIRHHVGGQSQNGKDFADEMHPQTEIAGVNPADVLFEEVTGERLGSTWKGEAGAAAYHGQFGSEQKRDVGQERIAGKEADHDVAARERRFGRGIRAVERCDGEPISLRGHVSDLRSGFTAA